MNNINDLFYQLIRVAIGKQDTLTRPPSIEEWKTLYQMAKKQCLVGICFSGIQTLIINYPSIITNLSEPFRLEWMGMTAKVQQTSVVHRKVLKKLSKFLEEKGHRAVFMKGLICAERYPEPLLRQCGDIDFVVTEEEFHDVMKALEEIAEVKHDLAHEHHGMAYISGVQLEPHYKIHNYQNPTNDRVMRAFQKELLDNKQRYMIQIDGANIEKFPLEFEGMFLLSHMVNHVYEEGLGLRQVIDFAMWINSLFYCDISLTLFKQSKSFDKKLFDSYTKSMHMTRPARIFTRICEKYLNVNRSIFEYKYTKDEIKFADRLMADIMTVGNFARGTDKQPAAGLQAYIRTLFRTCRLGYLCPSEAIWWPIGKFYRFFWRKYIKLVSYKKYTK